MEGDQIGQAPPASHKPVLTGPGHLVVLYVLHEAIQDDLFHVLEVSLTGL